MPAYTESRGVCGVCFLIRGVRALSVFYTCSKATLPLFHCAAGHRRKKSSVDWNMLCVSISRLSMARSEPGWTMQSQTNLCHVNEGLDAPLTRPCKSSARGCSKTGLAIMCNWADSVSKMGNDHTHWYGSHTHTQLIHMHILHHFCSHMF